MTAWRRDRGRAGLVDAIVSDLERRGPAARQIVITRVSVETDTAPGRVAAYVTRALLSGRIVRLAGDVLTLPSFVAAAAPPATQPNRAPGRPGLRVPLSELATVRARGGLRGRA